MSVKKNKRVSSIEVAKAAGVSQSTVSRVFSSKADLISAETRNRVMEVAKDLGYRPSILGRALSTATTKIIGIEINDFGNAYYMKALGMFSKAFQAKGYQMMIFSAENSRDLESKVKKALDYQVSGLILTNAVLSDDNMMWCEKYHTPVFLFNRISSEEHPVNAVLGDNRHGGYVIGRAFAASGFKRLLYVAGNKDSYTNLQRERGFKEGLEGSEVEMYRIQGNFSYDAGYEAARRMIGERWQIDGVFCASDSIALGFLDGVRGLSHIRIPEDLAVVGYDGIDEGENVNYLLTTYCQPLEEIVEETVKGMVDQIEGRSQEKIQEKFKGQLVVRNTFIPVDSGSDI